jgi:hypothetical protein
MSNELTPTQHAILAHAHWRDCRARSLWFPETLKGGARKKVIDGLFNRALITYDGTDWFVAAEGYEALGVPRKAPITSQALDEVIEAATDAKPRTRENSKQAQMIALLKRPEGATIAQMVEATGWQYPLRRCLGYADQCR